MQVPSTANCFNYMQFSFSQNNSLKSQSKKNPFMASPSSSSSPSPMEDLSDTLVIVRKEHMVSPDDGGNPTYREAHFLPPCVVSSIDEHSSHHNNLPSFSSSSIDPHNFPFKLSFPGWKLKALGGWESWVNDMISTHLSTWRNAGIHEAILGSTYKIKRDDDLVLGIAEKWCPKTQSFIFPWGEATISLEDMVILGGFSVLGDSVLQSEEQEEFLNVEEKLIMARSELNYSASKKPTLSAWMKIFKNTGSDIEHEAFLSYWLSSYVFPNNQTVHQQVFPLAIKLSRGSKIALAPAVLASIYRDLSSLKAKIFALSGNESENEVSDLNLTIKSPFHLVQAWVWERFPGLSPQPHLLRNGEPRLARWGNLQRWKKIENVREALDSPGEVFQWRPYCPNYAIRNWEIPKFYPENELLLPDGPGLDEDFISFARCLRVSELVGLDTIEQYLPNRVSMQFGMDQGIPCEVERFNETPNIAWTHYNMDISNFGLYVPPRLFEADVSERYLRWWKQPASHFVKPKRITGKVSEYRNFLRRKMGGEASNMGLEGNEGHENSEQKEASHFVKPKRSTGRSALEYRNYLKSKKLSKGGLERSEERLLGNEKVGEEEKQRLVSNLDDKISKLEKEVADRKAARFLG